MVPLVFSEVRQAFKGNTGSQQCRSSSTQNWTLCDLSSKTIHYKRAKYLQDPVGRLKIGRFASRISTQSIMQDWSGEGPTAAPWRLWSREREKKKINSCSFLSSLPLTLKTKSRVTGLGQASEPYPGRKLNEALLSKGRDGFCHLPRITMGKSPTRGNRFK